MMEEKETNMLSYRSEGWRMKKSAWLAERGKSLLGNVKTSVIAKIFEMS